MEHYFHLLLQRRQFFDRIPVEYVLLVGLATDYAVQPGPHIGEARTIHSLYGFFCDPAVGCRLHAHYSVPRDLYVVGQ